MFSSFAFFLVYLSTHWNTSYLFNSYLRAEVDGTFRGHLVHPLAPN